MSQPTDLTIQPKLNLSESQDIVIAELRAEIEKIKGTQPIIYVVSPPKSTTPFWVRNTLYWLAFGFCFPLGILLMVRDTEYRWKHFFIGLLVLVGLPILIITVLILAGAYIRSMTSVSTYAPTAAPTYAPIIAPPPDQQLYNLRDGFDYSIVVATGAIFDKPGGNIIVKLDADSVVTWKAMKGDCQWYLATSNSAFKVSEFTPGWVFTINELWIHLRDIQGFYPTAQSAQQALDGTAPRIVISAANKAKTTC